MSHCSDLSFCKINWERIYLRYFHGSRWYLSIKYVSLTHRCNFFIYYTKIHFSTHLTLNVVFLPLVSRTPPPWTALNARRRHSPGARWSRTIRSCSSRSFLASTNTERLVKHGMNGGYTFPPIYFPFFVAIFCLFTFAFFFFFPSYFFLFIFSSTYRIEGRFSSDIKVDRLMTS